MGRGMSHENDVYTKAVQADSSITGKRWCSNCQYGKDYRNGAWIISANKRQKRWMCKDCWERKQEREKK